MYDVIVIGIGAAGSVFARELSESGFSVLGLEYGEHHTNHMQDFVENEMGMWPLVWENNHNVSGDAFTGAPNLGKGVGGGTLAWAGAAFRLPSTDFAAYSTYGSLEGASLQDWPISLADMESYYDRAEVDMGVSGEVTPWDSPTRTPPPNPAFGYYPSGEMLRVGMQHLGIQYAPGPVARNSQPYDGRDSCLHCGFCRSGCRTDAKYQADRVLVQRALNSGNFELRTNTYVVKVHTSDSSGNATGVSYIDLSTGSVITESAKLVVVTNNPIETPRLLLNSSSSAHPSGIGNANDQIGRNFFAHPSTIAVGIVDECVSASIGYNMANIISLDHCTPGLGDNYIGGYSIQSLNGAGAGVMAVDPYRHLHGTELKDAMRKYNNSLFLIAFCEGVAVADNRITIDSNSYDEHGLPNAKVSYSYHSNDLEVFNAAKSRLNDILVSSGATSVVITDTPFESHPMGGMRMGQDPLTSATDSYGMVHGVSNLFIGGTSLFPSGGSVNPTLTLHALAIRSCDFIRDNWSLITA